MVFAIEAVIICFIFTICILAYMKNPLNEIYSYPPNIMKRVIELGLIEDKKVPNKLEVIKKKWPAFVISGILIGLAVYFVNNAHSFIEGFGISYGIWLIKGSLVGMVIGVPACLIAGILCQVLP